MNISTEVERLRAELQEAEQARIKKHYPNTPENCLDVVRVKTGPKWTRLDIGSSGAFMVNNTTGIVHGIKGYGTPHPKVIHGRVDKITGEALIDRRFARAHTAPIEGAMP